MGGIYSGGRMGGQLVFFNVTVRGTLPFNYSLSHGSSTLYTFYCLSYSWVGEKCEVRDFVVACWIICNGLTNLNEEDRSWNTYLQLLCFALLCFFQMRTSAGKLLLWCILYW